MPPSWYTFRLANDGFRFERRAIGFLESPEDASLDAGSVFDALGESKSRIVRTRFDYWAGGGDNMPSYFHGWNEAPYRGCFCFKWKEKRQRQRLYGFLCNPRPISQAGFRLCVLVYHDVKTQEETDFTILGRLNALRVHPAVKRAIGSVFPEYRSN